MVLLQISVDKMKNIISILTIVSVLTSCAPMPSGADISGLTKHFDFYPDYRGVTVPCNIAPLNFMILNDSVESVCLTINGNQKQLRQSAWGNKIIIDNEQWHQLLAQTIDANLTFCVAVKYNTQWLADTFEIFVSSDSIDPYITYRLIEPGYEVWNEIFIEERCLENFDTRFLANNNRLNNQCMNCHIHGQNGQTSMFYIRGNGGASFLYHNNKLRKTQLRNAQMRGGAVYGDISQSGKYGVFSTNTIIPALHSTNNNRLEVYDTESDLCIANFDTDQMILSPLVADTSTLETFPCFSADEKYVYFCSSPLPTKVKTSNVRELHYSILRIPFDGKQWGSVIDTIWTEKNSSASLLKASPNGKFLAFTRSAYGTFPIWHKEADLWIVNTNGTNAHSLTEANSNRSDTYLSWSGNSRWLAFASKRFDGQYGRVCITHIDNFGNATKAFIIPQRDPSHDLINLKSYNIPDLSPLPAAYSHTDVEKLFWEN